ncbi:hypothetical protein O6H91_03G030300 [Diphasiastrum complanatum]|uniref:Uncharacterized protein n=1 Tax=Diphasiastrum complanatum TaxID=34168 RepID=A0ACC2E4M7_DIPCM|nr:hypothetical protein O6H91_03G030300 [Diphasiastrum complanatum]
MHHAEDVVREFLLFRGFTHTLRTFDAELASDHVQGLQVDRIMDLFFTVYIPRFEADKMVNLLAFLNQTFFSPADLEYQSTVRKLDASLKKYYIVYALQKGRPDRIIQFFEHYGDSLLQNGEDWHSWFAIPYVRNPSTDPRFQIYFSKEWLDTLKVSLHNFLCEVFESIRLPALLKLVSKKLEIRALKHNLEQLRLECSHLQAALQCKDDEILHLKRSLPLSEIPQAQAVEVSDPFSGPSKSDNEALFTVPLSTPGDSSMLENKAASTPPASSADLSMSVKKQHLTEANLVPKTQSRYKDETGKKLQANVDAGLTMSSDIGGSKDYEYSDFDYFEVNVESQETFSGHTSPITRCRFSSTGKNIASASVDGTIRIWASDATASTSRNATIYCGAEILSLEWENRSNRLLLIGTAEHSIKAWNVDAKRVVCDLCTDTTYPRVLDICCSPTDPIFVSAASSDGLEGVEGLGYGTLHVWNMRTWKVMNVLPLGEDPPLVTSVCFNHNGKIIAAAATDGMIRLFDMNGCLPITGWPAHDGCGVSCVRFGHNETSIFSLGSDGKVLEWSLHNQGQILQSQDASRFCLSGQGKLPRHEMALGGHGRSLLLTSNLSSSPLYFFDRKSRVYRTLEHSGPITSVDWHPVMPLYLTGSVDHSVRVTKLLHAVNDGL